MAKKPKEPPQTGEHRTDKKQDSLLELLRSVDLSGFDLTRDRDTGRD